MTNKFWAYLLLLLPPTVASAQTVDTMACETRIADTAVTQSVIVESLEQSNNPLQTDRDYSGWKYCDPTNPYSQPYKFATSIEHPDWKRLWVNTGVLSGAFVGTLLVLECLPEDATSWNRASLQDIPLFQRWYNHVIKQGPEWDHDNPIFNYVLHPYAGAAYFMAARSCGFNFYRSLLYSACVSTIGWEFGIEAFMERPSYQDLFITPLVGSAIGEGFYQIKRRIADNGYELAGSRFLGGLVAFLVDPVNEVVGCFMGNPARQYGKYRASVKGSMQPWMVAGYSGFSISLSF